eukprot:SAG31_NODE_19784_length_591_cov_2.022358_1_plen_78_part_10
MCCHWHVLNLVVLLYLSYICTGTGDEFQSGDGTSRICRQLKIKPDMMAVKRPLCSTTKNSSAPTTLADRNVQIDFVGT